MALRYGTVPIVRETGGLKDTVWPYNEYEGTGTGFHLPIIMHMRCWTVSVMRNMYIIIKNASGIRLWTGGMAADFSWHASAMKYQELYDWLIGY